MNINQTYGKCVCLLKPISLIYRPDAYPIESICSRRPHYWADTI